MRVAIYDLDKTLVRKATFTPFLAFAARKIAPWRLGLLPMWVLMMVGYKMGFYSRTSLKTAGMRLMLGKVPSSRLDEVGAAFARRHIERAGWLPGIIKMVEDDRAKGAKLLVATAAFEFYAKAFADSLNIPNVIGTKWNGKSIPGGNCYAESKRQRVVEWLGNSAEGIEMRFVSDSFADEPLLELSDEPIFVTTSAAKKRRAEARGWMVVSGD